MAKPLNTASVCCRIANRLAPSIHQTFGGTSVIEVFVSDAKFNQLRQRRTVPQIVEMDAEGINVSIGTKTDDDPYALQISTLEPSTRGPSSDQTTSANV